MAALEVTDSRILVFVDWGPSFVGRHEASVAEVYQISSDSAEFDGRLLEDEESVTYSAEDDLNHELVASY